MPLLAVDIDRLLAEAPPEDPSWAKIAVTYREIKGPEPAQYDLTIAELRELIKAWSKSKKRGKQEIVEALRAVCEGQAFAQAGQRDNMLYRICATLAEKHPYASPESVGRLLAPSLALMGMDGPQLEDALEKMSRRKREERTKAEVDRDSRIAAYFKGRRDTPYTDAEIKAFEEQVESSMKRRWIIQKGRSYYLFGGLVDSDGVCREGTYFGPYTHDDVGNAARSILAPAVSAGVTFDITTEKTQRAKSPVELVREYGEVAACIAADLTANYSYYDTESSTLVEAACPIRDIVPREHREIDRWLRLFAGKEYPRLLEWIAGVTLLREPASALYVEGAPGTGKTLLAQGLARLWSKQGPANFEEALNPQFNEALLQCPLVFGDEVAPKDFRGRVRTSEIREFIQARQRPLKRKWLPGAVVRGCVRLILAANNRELLASNEHLTTNDISALVERFFYIHTEEMAAEYLRTLMREKPGTIEAWVEQDHIAEHALYLRDTVLVKRHARLIASGHASELTRSLTTSTGIRSAVCNWLVSFLLDPSRLLGTDSRALVRVHEGRLAVNTRVFTDHWDLYRTNTPSPTSSRISQAVSGLASPGRIHLRDHQGRETYYRLVDTNNLVTWAEETGFATADGVRNAITALEQQSVRRQTATN